MEQIVPNNGCTKVNLEQIETVKIVKVKKNWSRILSKMQNGKEMECWMVENVALFQWNLISFFRFVVGQWYLWLFLIKYKLIQFHSMDLLMLTEGSFRFLIVLKKIKIFLCTVQSTFKLKTYKKYASYFKNIKNEITSSSEYCFWNWEKFCEQRVYFCWRAGSMNLMPK